MQLLEDYLRLVTTSGKVNDLDKFKTTYGGLFVFREIVIESNHFKEQCCELLKALVPSGRSKGIGLDTFSLRETLDRILPRNVRMPRIIEADSHLKETWSWFVYDRDSQRWHSAWDWTPGFLR